MPIHDTTTTVVVHGSGELEARDLQHLDKLIAGLGPCPTGCSDVFFYTLWTPLRTVASISCGTCMRPMLEAPTLLGL